MSSFTTDGCSRFPEGTPNDPDLWCQCCFEHDRRYWVGGTSQERLQADRELEACVTAAGAPDTAHAMYLGVRLGGSPCWPTGYRWGYGWPYYRGYKPLSDEERGGVDKLWQEYRNNTECRICPDTQTGRGGTSDDQD